jgi:hypothetical protein
VDIIPSHLQTRGVGEAVAFDDTYGKVMLVEGEIKTIIYPEDPDSRTKKFVEYHVLAQVRANGTAVTMLVRNCLPINHLAGLADSSFQLYRADTPQPGPSTDEASTSALGFGSKVLLLHLGGSSAEPIIVGGIRDERDTDVGRKALGVHMQWRYNGVEVKINDDGSWSVTRLGPTTPTGDFDPERGAESEANGTSVEVNAEGTIKVSTPDDAQTVVIDHKAGTITITGDQDLTVHADKIHIGRDADQAAVLGNVLVDLLGQLIDIASKQTTYPTPSGPSGTALNVAQWQALKQRLPEALSQFVTVKKTP